MCIISIQVLKIDFNSRLTEDSAQRKKKITIHLFRAFVVETYCLHQHHHVLLLHPPRCTWGGLVLVSDYTHCQSNPRLLEPQDQKIDQFYVV